MAKRGEDFQLKDKPVWRRKSYLSKLNGESSRNRSCKNTDKRLGVREKSQGSGEPRELFELWEKIRRKVGEPLRAG